MDFDPQPAKFATLAPSRRTSRAIHGPHPPPTGTAAHANRRAHLPPGRPLPPTGVTDPLAAHVDASANPDAGMPSAARETARMSGKTLG